MWPPHVTAWVVPTIVNDLNHTYSKLAHEYIQEAFHGEWVDGQNQITTGC